MTLTLDTDIKRLLEQTKTIAVVGYSNDPNKASNGVAHFLMSAGFDVYFVNPTLESSDDERIYRNLAEITVPIDVVDIFRRPEAVPAVVEEAIALHAKTIWMQLGIVNEEAARRAESAGLQVVMDRCMRVEARRLLGSRKPVSGD